MCKYGLTEEDIEKLKETKRIGEECRDRLNTFFEGINSKRSEVLRKLKSIREKENK